MTGSESHRRAVAAEDLAFANGARYQEVRFYESDASPGFEDWLAAEGLSLAFTTSGSRLFLVGRRPNGSLSVQDVAFDGCRALAVDQSGALYVSTRFQIWRLVNALPPGEQTDAGHDRIYVPRYAWTTGYLDIHDLDLDPAGTPLFANTLFNCVASVSDHDNFRRIWQPRFISEVASGDRCHLTGLAVYEGRPAFATAAGAVDVVDGWHARAVDGGILVDIGTGRTVVGGLSMPFSPRTHDGHVWLANRGTGELGIADARAGRFEPVARFPGLVRGLAISGNYAVVGVSKPSQEDLSRDLPVVAALEESGEAARIGVLVVDLRTGRIAHHLFVEARELREVFDVAVLTATRPLAVGLNGEEIQHNITIGPPSDDATYRKPQLA